MTKYTDERARELFNACGYGTECEYVKVDRDKFTARCKAHGHEFMRDNNILRKPQKKLRCPECHEQKVTAALEYYKQGHSRYECADKFGLTPIQVQNYAAFRGVHGGLSQEQRSEFVRAVQKKASAKSAEKARKRGELTRNAKRIRKGFDELSAELDQWRKFIDVIDNGSSANAKVFACLGDWVSGEYDWSKSSLYEYEPQIATCKYCGAEWLFFPSHEKYGRRKAPSVCSQRCANRHFKTGNISDRLRKRGRANEYRDYITLDEVIKRDNGICYLCGCKTDKADSYKDVNGYFVCGDTYPTRDHVIPIAKGGTHTWDNVRLACRKCNSVKNDRLLHEYMTNGG